MPKNPDRPKPPSAQQTAVEKRDQEQLVSERRAH